MSAWQIIIIAVIFLVCISAGWIIGINMQKKKFSKENKLNDKNSKEELKEKNEENS